MIHFKILRWKKWMGTKIGNKIAHELITVDAGYLESHYTIFYFSTLEILPNKKHIQAYLVLLHLEVLRFAGIVFFTN